MPQQAVGDVASLQNEDEKSNDMKRSANLRRLKREMTLEASLLTQPSKRNFVMQ
jgi:hypothetical protein